MSTSVVISHIAEHFEHMFVYIEEMSPSVSLVTSKEECSVIKTLVVFLKRGGELYRNSGNGVLLLVLFWAGLQK